MLTNISGFLYSIINNQKPRQSEAIREKNPIDKLSENILEQKYNKIMENEIKNIFNQKAKENNKRQERKVNNELASIFDQDEKNQECSDSST
jgi:hemoglobin-like flavoprotein